MRHPIRALTASVLAVGLIASGCSKNVGTDSEGGAKATVRKVVMDTEGTAATPVAEVEGAKKGGTVQVFKDADFEYMDPQGIYVSDALTTSTQLVHRALTGYIEDPKGGDLKLVGDLATNTGKTSDGGKTWEYKLRDGIKFEDGTAITSKDIAYGVARSFSDEPGSHGPQYIQTWLQKDRTYKGPYNGGAALPPGVTTPDDKTIVFSFSEAHPDFPGMAALPTTTPVPQAKDTKAAYNTAWVSAGPYKLKPGSYKKDQSMTLVRNEAWDPKSDPIRHQYVDEFQFRFDVSDTNQAQRLIADAGEDQTAIQVNPIPVALISQVRNNADLKDRIIDGETPFARYIAINTQRVKDVDVRRAANLAFNRDSYLKSIGGSTAGSFSSTILSPTVPGFKKYNAYPTDSPSGDVDKAKKLLEGKTVAPMNYCFPNRPVGQTVAAGVKNGLERAGFQVNLQPVDPAAYYKTIGKRSTTCDLMPAGWGADIQDASTFIPPLMDGTTIVEEGNQNFAYLNDETVNKKIKELSTEIDREKAATEYGELDEYIMKNLAPVIPTIYDRNYTLVGSKLGGAFLTPLYGQTSFVNLYVK